MSQKQFMGYLGVSLLVALAAGAYLVVSTGLTTLILLATGLFFLLFYTWPLYLSAHAFQYNKRFGSLFLLGLIIDVILVKTGVY